MATAPAPITETPSLAALRIMCANLTPKNGRLAGERVAEALLAAGIEISDDEGNYLEADDVIEKLGQPEPAACEGFHMGYAEAAHCFWYGQYGLDNDGDKITSEEAEGAEFYRNVSRGLARAIECHQYRELPGIPHEMIAARVA